MRNSIRIWRSMRGWRRLRRTQRQRLRSMKGVKDQISSISTKRPSRPAARPSAALKGRARYSWWRTAGTESTTPPSMAQPGPTSRPRRMTVSKEMSAARKLGTLVRTQTPRVSGTRKKASRAAVWPWAAMVGKEQPLEGARPGQRAGHRCGHAQLDQQRDDDERIGHPITVSQ